MRRVIFSAALVLGITLFFPPRFASAAAPVLTSISPSTVVAGAAGFTMTLTGSGFVNPQSVLWDGVARPTTYVSSTSLTATIYTSDVAKSGSKAVSVTGAAGASGVKTFTVSCGAPFLVNSVPSSLVKKDTGLSLLTVYFTDDPACGPWSLWWSGLQQASTSTVGSVVKQFNWATESWPVGTYAFQIKNAAGLYSAAVYLEIADEPLLRIGYWVLGSVGAWAFIMAIGQRW